MPQAGETPPLGGHKVEGDGNVVLGNITQSTVTIVQPPGGPPRTAPAPEPLPAEGTLPEPGPQRAGWYLPVSRNNVFTGRVPDLLALAAALLYHPQAGVTAITALKGEGGIGKSQLAVEFAYRYGRCFHGVHWIAAGETGDVAAGIAACGAQMDLPGWPERLPEQVTMTLNAWAETPQRLVILDNLEDPDKLRPWLGRLGACRLLLTTRRGSWPTELGVRGHALGVLPPDEARELLRKLAPRLEATPDADLDALSSHLGGLPLALDLAGRYLEEVGGVSAAAYRAEIQSGGSLKHPSLVDWTRTTPTAHAASLAATFALSFDQLNDDSPYDALAQRLFYAAGYCAPHAPIPPELLQKAVEAEDAPTFARALRRLADLGLLRDSSSVREGEGGPSLHPLLAEFARLVEPPDCGALSGLAKALMEMSNAAYETRLPGPWQPLRAHLEAATPLAEAAGLEQAGELWGCLGLCLEQFVQYPAARTCYERALAIDERVYGNEHPEVATLASNLGDLLRTMGDLAGAKTQIERALAIDEQVYGREHPSVATDASNLGLVLRALGDLAGAKALYERALAIDEQVYGREHPNVARDANNLGGVLQDLGDLAGAKALYERALAIAERVYGKEHPEVATDANNLGLVLQDLGDLAGAREQIERALAIGEQVYGKEHPSVAIRLVNLGALARDEGDLPAARDLFRRALGIFTRFLPPEHGNIQTAREWLEDTEREMGG